MEPINNMLSIQSIMPVEWRIERTEDNQLEGDAKAYTKRRSTISESVDKCGGLDFLDRVHR